MPRKQKRKCISFIKITFVFVFIFVFGLYLERLYKDYKQDLEDAKITAELQNLLNTNITIYEEVIPEETNGSITRLEVSSKDLLVSNVSYIGVVEIPSLGIKKPIVEGVTKKDIASKVGWETHSSMPGNGGNVVLAAHNASNFFGNIYQLTNGKEIIVTTKEGIFTYKVFDKFKVYKNEVWVYNKLDNYNETVTLITCNYPDTNYRWIVRGELIKIDKL